ncbi:acetyltransferase-like isoleucine patch superfamily enzyme [Bradyrhizobium sp. LM3.4]
MSSLSTLVRRFAHAIDGFNLHYIVQRLVGRATCRLERDAFLAHSARIRNALGKSERIVIGSHSHVRGELMILGHGGQITIGEWCYVGVGTRIWSGASIDIGNRVLISHSVNIFDNLSHIRSVPLSGTNRRSRFSLPVTQGSFLLTTVRSRFAMMRGSVLAPWLCEA